VVVRARGQRREDDGVRVVIGLTLTQACGRPGSVLAWMNTLLPNASGNMTMNPNPCGSVAILNPSSNPYSETIVT
jgi:hypothetical protein